MKNYALAVVLALAACGKTPVDSVKDAYVTLPAVQGRPGAAYFVLHGGPKDNVLIEMSSPQAVRVELHESAMTGGMMTMKPLEGGVGVPAGGSVAFKPGGKHAMLYDISPSIKAGGKITLSFRYADGRALDVDADVRAPGDADGHEGH